MRWDIDGNGTPDVGPDGRPIDSADVTVRLGQVGSTVTLWIEDPITGSTESVSRDIVLPEEGSK